MLLNIHLAINLTNELHQNQNILELVEDYSIRSLCSVQIPARSQKPSFKFYNPAIVIVGGVIATSDRNTVVTAIKETSSLLLLSQA